MQLDVSNGLSQYNEIFNENKFLEFFNEYVNSSEITSQASLSKLIFFNKCLLFKLK